MLTHKVKIMKRLLYSKLLEWKNKKSRKPLILEGARQVGKTWLLKEFGKNEYENVAYINCDNNKKVQDLFSDFNIPRIIMNLSAIANTNILPEKTLIILDEIQEVPLAITSLKYFNEDAPEYHIAVAGSLLGLKVHEGTGFPVGKTEGLKLYPLSFKEFLLALKKDILVGFIEKHNWKDLNPLNSELIELLRQYYFVGGMPAVVQEYVSTKDLIQVRQLQKEILSGYENDFSKHAPNSQISKISMVWNSIPSQLAKENKKFIYGAMKPGARAKEFEDSIQWLINAGLIHKVKRVKKIEMPLKFYEDISAFKIYINDLGLLGAMCDTPAQDILIGSDVFTSYKGSFTEQYIAQQFISELGESLYYYSNERSTLEIDFVIQTNKVYPIEVKAEENLKSKSLSLVLKYSEDLYGIRFSMSYYREQERMNNIPLPLAQEYVKALAYKGRG